MPETLKIVCPRCSAVNRIQSDRLSDHPKCGKCSEEVFAGRPMELSAANFEKPSPGQKFRWSSISGLPGAARAR